METGGVEPVQSGLNLSTEILGTGPPNPAAFAAASGEDAPLLGNAKYGGTPSTPAPAPAAGPSSDKFGGRIASLDQFRGLTVLTLLIVPVLGSLDAMPSIFKHNGDYFSFADAIMPRYYVAVGYAMQLSLSKAAARQGRKAMVLKQLSRSATLYFIGLLYHGLPGFPAYAGPGGLQENWWYLFEWLIWGRSLYETLTIIAVAQVLILPVITRPWQWRAAYFFVLHAIYIAGDYTFHFERNGQYIDGGSFGTFSWATVMLVGTFLHDLTEWANLRNHADPVDVRHAPWRETLRKVAYLCAPMVLLALALMAAGIAFSAIWQSLSPACYIKYDRSVFVPCLDGSYPSWPFVVPSIDTVSMFTMSQPSATFTIQLFGAGWAIVPAFLGCFIVADLFGHSFNVLNVLSYNALLMYILCDLGNTLAASIIPYDSPAWLVIVALAISLTVNLTIAYYLRRHNLYLHV